MAERIALKDGLQKSVLSDRNENSSKYANDVKCFGPDTVSNRGSENILPKRNLNRIKVNILRWEDCGEEILHTSQMKDRQKDSHDSKLFQCKTCETRFIHKRSLIRHELVHTGIKPFQCEKCDKKFTRKGHLTEHELVHLGIKPFQCEKCDKRFSQRQSLVYHERLHSGILPFQCKTCDKRFVKRASLTYHEKIHSGIMPFKCEQCDERFTYKEQLRQHQRKFNVSGCKEFHYCIRCLKRFCDGRSIKIHTKMHSEIIEEKILR